MFLFPPSCASCGEPSATLCASCRAQLLPAGPVAEIDGLRSCRALLDYDRTGRALVAGLKYHNRRALVAELGRALAGLWSPDRADLVTWVPTADHRRRRRGYDQARLLAAAVAASLGLDCRATLRRVSQGHQTGRPRRQRLDGPGFDLRPTAAREVGGAHVLVVDDVVTTGASLRDAAGALRRSGAAWVDGLILARTPLKVPAVPTDDN